MISTFLKISHLNQYFDRYCDSSYPIWLLFFFQNYAATMFFVSIHSIWETLVLFLDLVMCKLKEWIIYSISRCVIHFALPYFYIGQDFQNPQDLFKRRSIFIGTSPFAKCVVFLREFNNLPYHDQSQIFDKNKYTRFTLHFIRMRSIITRLNSYIERIQYIRLYK